jgi:hypothetical protein
MNKTSIITCAFVLSASLLAAQDNSKQEVKVRIKKIENINGVEKVTDTTFTTTDPGAMMGPDGNIHIRNLGEGKEGNVVIVRSKDGESRAEVRTFTRGEIDAEVEKALKEAGVDPNSKRAKKVIIVNEDSEIKKGDKKVTRFIFVKTDLKEASEGECKKAGIKTSPEKLVIEDMNCMPNPSNGKFNLKFSSPDKSDADITVKDINGKVVYSESVKNFDGKYDKEISLGDTAKGIYFVTITQGAKATTRKLVVE